MSYLLMSFLLVLIAPLLIATWRTSLAGLALQGLLMTGMVTQQGPVHSVATVVLLADLILVRTLFVPIYFRRILSNQRAPRRNDVIPANLLFWALGGALLLIAFRFSNLLSVPGATGGTHLAVATSAVLLGFLILATQNSPFSQIVGVLRIENGIVLFELLVGEHLPLPVQIGVALVFVATVLTFGAFLRRMDRTPATVPAEGPSL
jgi:hydrogenase-4 membrane subunit HyfE